MRYAELVAQIAEETRTLVQTGSEGEFIQNDSVFFVGENSALGMVCPGFRLKILAGPAQGIYTVVSIPRAGHLELDRSLPANGRGVSWELYDEGLSAQAVRQVLDLFPDAVMACGEGERVVTPLGVFRIVRRNKKRVRLPSGEWTFARELIQARIRLGKRLQREVSGVSPQVHSEEDLV